MKKILSITLVFFVGCFAIYLYLPLNMIFCLSEILEVQLPKDVECNNYWLNTEGKDRSTYMLWAVLEGKEESMKIFLDELKMKTFIPEDYKGTVNMYRIAKLSWWTPPSVAEQTNYQFFANEIHNLKQKQNYVKIQAELIGEKTFLIQSGNIKDLKKRIKKRSKFRWLFI